MDWISEDEKSRPIGYLNETEEKKRKDLIQGLEGVISYEKKRLEKARLQSRSRKQEEDKRQLKLF